MARKENTLGFTTRNGMLNATGWGEMRKGLSLQGRIKSLALQHWSWGGEAPRKGITVEKELLGQIGI